MVYSEQGNVICTHVSRTGGAAITNCLHSHFPDARTLVSQHAPLAACRLALAERFDEALEFAIVRNPWDRLVSWYAHIRWATLGGEADPAEVAEPDSEHWSKFEEFLETWAELDTRVGAVTRRNLSQWGRLADVDGTLSTDEIGRFEAFEHDAVRLLARIGIDRYALPVVNAAPHEHYSTYYSDRGRDLVARVFPEDVEYFGYAFEDAAGR